MLYLSQTNSLARSKYLTDWDFGFPRVVYNGNHKTLLSNISTWLFGCWGHRPKTTKKIPQCAHEYCCMWNWLSGIHSMSSLITPLFLNKATTCTVKVALSHHLRYETLKHLKYFWLEEIKAARYYNILHWYRMCAGIDYKYPFIKTSVGIQNQYQTQILPKSVWFFRYPMQFCWNRCKTWSF